MAILIPNEQARRIFLERQGPVGFLLVMAIVSDAIATPTSTSRPI